MSIPREIESAIYDLVARASDPYSCVEDHPEYEWRRAAQDALVAAIERAIADAVAAERKRCAALADACHMERVLQHPEALKAGGDAAAVAAKASEAARIAAAIRRSTLHAEPVSDAYKLAEAVRPWRELVERAVRTADRVPLQWYEDAKALLEKPCSTS